MLKIIDDRVRSHRLLTTQTAYPVPTILDHILEHPIGADLIPGFGQVNQMVVNPVSKHSPEILVVLS